MAVPMSDRPNVVWLLSDQHRGQAMSCAGDPNARTPNMDRLAAEGVWFRGAVSGFPLCCPARGSILTSRYPHEAVPGHEHRLPPDLPTIADAFNGAGYHTAWFGKWHVDGFHEADGRAAFHAVPRERRGRFKTWLGYENNNAPFDCHVHGHRDDEEIGRRRLPTFETDALTDLLLEHLTRRAEAGEPFFAACSVQPPHDPYAAPADYMGRYNPATLTLRGNVPPIRAVEEVARRELAGYYALIENLDHNLGRIRQHIERLGLSNRTYVIYFSDHGDHHGSHGHFRKLTPYDEAVRVPFIIGGPLDRDGAIHRESDAVLNHVDVPTTTLGLCGIAPMAGAAGFDYSPLVQSRKIDERALPEAALLQCVIPTGHGPSVDRPWRGIVCRDGWKYATFEGAPYLMFETRADPLELHNMAHHAAHAAKRRELQGRLRRLLADAGDAFAVPD